MPTSEVSVSIRWIVSRPAAVTYNGKSAFGQLFGMSGWLLYVCLLHMDVSSSVLDWIGV